LNHDKEVASETPSIISKSNRDVNFEVQTHNHEAQKRRNNEPFDNQEKVDLNDKYDK
jgi:hypothetical protein